MDPEFLADPYPTYHRLRAEDERRRDKGPVDGTAVLSMAPPLTPLRRSAHRYSGGPSPWQSVSSRLPPIFRSSVARRSDAAQRMIGGDERLHRVDGESGEVFEYAFEYDSPLAARRAGSERLRELVSCFGKTVGFSGWVSSYSMDTVAAAR